MNWKLFLKPTIGKVLLTAFFLIVPVPFPRAVAELFHAKYAPIISIPFLNLPTAYAYFTLVLIAICFYLLSALVSNLYHRFVLVKR